jgi:hypothetical protein
VRLKHESKPVDRLTYTDRGESVWQSNLTELVSLLAEPRPAGAPMFDPVYLATSLFHDPEEGTVEDFLPGVYEAPWSLTAKKGKNDPDYPTYAEAMSGPYREHFIAGMQKEIAELERKDTWVKVDRSSVPKGTQIIRTTWAFRIARLPSGEIKKWKSRYVVRGDTQGSNVTMDCYSPTVSWSTVRMLMALAVQLKLHTRAIDISNAFVTSPMPAGSKVYVEMPRDFEEDGKVFLLKKSLYGQKEAPALFFSYLRDKLVNDLGFQESSNDRCMFHKPGLVAVVYLDDMLFFSKDNAIIDQAISELETRFEITKDAPDQTVFAYLGIEVEWLKGEDGKDLI